MTTARGVVMVLGAAVLGVAALIGGFVAIGYVAVYVAATLPGWPIGFALFGRRHRAAEDDAKVPVREEEIAEPLEEEALRGN